MKTLNQTDLIALAHGCCFFASGGGGSLTSGLNLLQNFTGTTTLVDKATAVADSDGFTLVVAYIGAPNAIENLGRPIAAINAFHLMNKVAGGKIRYVVPVEQGSLSTIVACTVANELGIAVVDGDGAGRAVPSLPMLTYAPHVPMDTGATGASGATIPSAILASKDDQRVEVFVKTPSAVEGIARPFISSGIPGFDQAAGLAIWLMDSATLDAALTVTGSVSTSLALGQMMQRGLGSDPYRAILSFLGTNNFTASCIFQGIMTKPVETTAGGFDMDKVIIKGTGDVDLHIYCQNESLIAWATNSPKPVVVAPDSICYLTADGKAFSNADINEHIIGTEVAVFAILAREQITSEPTIMAAFSESLTNLGYPSLYTPWNKITS